MKTSTGLLFDLAITPAAHASSLDIDECSFSEPPIMMRFMTSDSFCHTLLLKALKYLGIENDRTMGLELSVGTVTKYLSKVLLGRIFV